MIVVGSGLLRPKQMRLNELFTVERYLSSNGFRMVAEGEGLDTFLAKNHWTVEEANLTFEVFDNRNKRAQLLDLSLEKHVNMIDPTVAQYIGLSGFNLNREAFSHTFEWYVGELLVRRFGAFSSSYGVEVADIVRNSDSGTIGDFDVLTVLGSMELLYVECKNGSFDRAKITNMLERARSLHALACVMFVENISIPSLKAQIEGISYPGLPKRPEFCAAKIKGLPNSEVYQLHDAFFISAVTGSVDVESKIRSVLRLIACKKAELNRDVAPGQESYAGSGYEVNVLLPMEQ